MLTSHLSYCQCGQTVARGLPIGAIVLPCAHHAIVLRGRAKHFQSRSNSRSTTQPPTGRKSYLIRTLLAKGSEWFAGKWARPLCRPERPGDLRASRPGRLAANRSAALRRIGSQFFGQRQTTISEDRQRSRPRLDDRQRSLAAAQRSADDESTICR